MNTTNRTQLSPNLDPGGPNPTWLNPNLDPGGPTRPKIGSKLGSFGFIKYITGLNPNLNPIWGKPDPNGPVFWPVFLPWGPTRPDSTQILGPKLGSTQKNGSGLAALLQSLQIFFKIYMFCSTHPSADPDMNLTFSAPSGTVLHFKLGIGFLSLFT